MHLQRNESFLYVEGWRYFGNGQGQGYVHQRPGADMARHVWAKDCPVYDFFDLFGKKWRFYVTRRLQHRIGCTKRPLVQGHPKRYKLHLLALRRLRKRPLFARLRENKTSLCGFGHHVHLPAPSHLGLTHVPLRLLLRSDQKHQRWQRKQNVLSGRTVRHVKPRRAGHVLPIQLKFLRRRWRQHNQRLPNELPSDPVPRERSARPDDRNWMVSVGVSLQGPK